MGGKFVPKLNWEVGIGCAQCSDNTILEGLDGLFISVDVVVVWFDKWEADLLRYEVGLDFFCGLIVHDIKFWFVTLFIKIFKILFISSQDAGRVDAQDWSGEDSVSLIMVHDEETNLSIEQHKRKFAGTVVVHDTGGFVRVSSKTEDVCN